MDDLIKKKLHRSKDISIVDGENCYIQETVSGTTPQEENDISIDLQKKAMLRKKEAQRNAYAAAHHLTQQQLELLRQYDEELCNEEALHHGAALREQLKKAKGHTLKVRINCENMGYLFDSTSLCNEEDYYNGRAGLYIQAVLEEYCRLEYSQREKIYFPLPAVQTGKTLLEILRVRFSSLSSLPLPK